jgi:hypothetical protein
VTSAFLIVAYVAMPLWLAAGFSDYLCHRVTEIERTSGWKESVLHLLMFAEAGIPALAALAFEADALILLALFVGFLFHEVTALRDVSFAMKRRHVSPFEQHVHSFLEIIPLTILLLLASANEDQALALIGFGTGTADFSLRLRQPQLPMAYLIALGIGVAVLAVFPYVEELVRGLRARQADPIQSSVYK